MQERFLLAKMARWAALKQLHGFHLTRGTQEPSQWIRIIKHYLSQGSLREGLLIYTQTLPNRTQHPILPLILKACASFSNLWLGESLHAESIKAGVVDELLPGTTLVSMYCKLGRVSDARKVFDGMPERNVVTYNAMIGGYAANGDMESASALFELLSDRTPVTWATMIDGFARDRRIVAARCLFDRVPPGMRTVVTWTVMVHGYTINGDMDAARELFDKMPVRNYFAWSSMIAGYFKKGDTAEARAVFDRMPDRNLVNWNTLIAGYNQLGCCEQALQAFVQMNEQGFEPDEFTAASVLSACAQLGCLKRGKEMHKLIDRKKIKKNYFVQNGLVDMYAKCGDLEEARRIFEGLRRRNDTCWNAMISGLASHGRSEEALAVFARMEQSEEKPNAVTFLSVLTACTHGGLVDEGLDIWTKMEYEYRVTAGVEHYGCLVDLLGRAGRLEEAYDVVMKMPMKPNEIVWGALLGACRVYVDTEMADRLLSRVFDLNAEVGSSNDAEYVVVANIYAAAERWEAAESTRRKMAENRIEKIPGCSSIVEENLEYQFYAGALAN